MLRVGKIVAVHGLQGAVVLKQIIDNTGWLNAGDVLFIELKRESFIPHFVEKAKPANETEYIINLDEVDDSEQAKKLVGKTVYVKEEILEKAKVDSPLMYIGFNLVDKTKGGIGTIEDVLLMGKQWIARLTIDGKEVLIPLVEDMILDVNYKNKFLRMDLPDGLLEIYLGSA
ncbi:MAG TPA: ribosome maturation factor RimM [Flavipsychrobacter sp.]